MRVLLLVFSILLFALCASAQTSRSKPKPLATPPPTLTGAEIISRAGQEPEPTPVGQPVEKPIDTDSRVRDLTDRINKLESGQRGTYDEKQKRLLLNLDILTRAEQRTESLRKQVFELIEKENALRTRIDQIDFDIRPEMIERSLQLSGSMKPEEIRDNRRKSLAAEKANLQSLMTDVQNTRGSINTSLQRAEAMVEKLRAKLEKDIDDALLADEPENP